ncbi:flagellar biosynthesis repressor FlbT [Pelagimonas phthalicica]|uniref:Flagellar biosynthesis repressor FlbT n=1 Tax=Pelagimonas phthalicica TaxID=1037362 RepID=A0A238J6X5_9RHOB|nr:MULTISPECIES: flagellar biosynthesis repressor FlbT [Roseobacteraceae]MBO9463873.1 flagellar biosynthesis repressor FlbT [Tropicibacter sp. R15_0]TDS95351.1 flagellar protein FlbT [Pelagimonas phthalicica]SMX26125.1 flagellar biosynthesis repressor FlbT [Pelagimonas phthalicica]
MSGLVLKLGPRERVLINGAVIENGDRRSRMSIVTPNANVLRLRDAIHPDEAVTPVRRLCYTAQLILTGDSEPTDARQQLLPRIEELSHILIDADSRRLLTQATDALLGNQFYQCLKALRALIPREDRLLAAGQQ